MTNPTCLIGYGVNITIEYRDRRVTIMRTQTTLINYLVKQVKFVAKAASLKVMLQINSV